MRIEYFDTGSDDCPLVLIFGNDPIGAANLSSAIERLTSGAVSRIAVHELPGYASVNRCELFATLAESNIGIRRIGSGPVFECALDGDRWLEIIGLIEPFATRPEEGALYFQGLDETSETKLMISTDRQW